MGVETLAIVASVSTAVGAYSGIEQSRQAGKAAKSQKEASDISGAQAQNQEAEARRQRVREERVRRAQIEQASTNTGVSSSSGELGSIAGLATSTQAQNAISRSNALAAQGITSANQSTANAQLRGQIAGSIGNLSSSIGSAAGGLGTIFDAFSTTKK